MRTTRSFLEHSYGVALTRVGFRLCLVLLGSNLPARASDFVVEGSIDETPVEIKKLSQRAAALESRVREVEQRIAESQKQILGDMNKNSVEYKLELKIGNPEGSASKQGSVAVSHVLLSIDGRPFSYAQSAVIVAPEIPLPLFLGRILEGKYLLRLRLQAAPVDDRIASSATAAWQTFEKTIPVEVVAEAGLKQVQSIEIESGSEGLKFNFGRSEGLESPRETRRYPEKM